MVLDDLRAADHRRPGALGDGLRGPRRGAALNAGADGARLQAAAFPRHRKIAARVRDGLGLPLVLATADRLGGEPAARDSVLPAADAEQLAVDRRAVDRVAFRSAVRAAALERFEATREVARGGRGIGDRDEGNGPLVAGRAGIPPPGPDD